MTSEIDKGGRLSSEQSHRYSHCGLRAPWMDTAWDPLHLGDPEPAGRSWEGSRGEWVAVCGAPVLLVGELGHGGVLWKSSL